MSAPLTRGPAAGPARHSAASRRRAVQARTGHWHCVPGGYERDPSLHNVLGSKQSRTGKHQAAVAIGRVRPLAAGTESEDHNEHDQYI